VASSDVAVAAEQIHASIDASGQLRGGMKGVSFGVRPPVDDDVMVRRKSSGEIQQSPDRRSHQ
jgi:hypothetical protein